MSKPSWEDAPDWANWLAKDGNGEWFWYAVEPKWDSDYCTFTSKLHTQVVYADFTESPSIERRP